MRFIKKILINSFVVFLAHGLSLPPSICQDSVHYNKSSSIAGWSCGYHALLNALKLECQFGSKNINAHFDNFKLICLQLLQASGNKPANATSNAFLELLGQKLDLKVQPITFSAQDGLLPIMNERVSISYPSSLSKEQVQQLLHKAYIQKSKNRLKELKDYLYQSSSSSCSFIHFICHISSVERGHWVLASVVKNRLGKQELFIFDNLNSPITEHSEIKLYITALCDYFSIGQKYNHSFVSTKYSRQQAKQNLDFPINNKISNPVSFFNKAVLYCARN